MSPAPRSKRKILSTVVILGLLALVVVIDIQRRNAEAKLASLSMRMEEMTGGNTEENRTLAKQIVSSLSVIMNVPEGIEPTVATITDVAKLQAQNAEFYADAKDGDQLVIYPTFAVIFDEEANDGKGKIINFAPVQITQPPAGQEAAAGQPAAAPAPTPAQ